MSELIDNIADIPKIKAQIDAIKNYIEELKTTIAGFSSEVNKEIGNVRAAKNQDDLAKSSKALNDTMVKSKQTLSEYEKQQKQLQVVQEKLNVVYSDANKEIIRKQLEIKKANEAIKEEITGAKAAAKAKQELIELQKKESAAAKAAAKEQEKNNKLSKEQIELNKLSAVLNSKEAGTLDKLAAQNKILAIEKRKLNLETEEGVERLKEIIEQENKNNEAMKVGQNEVQKQAANIGNYKNSLAELFDGLKSGETSVGGFIKGLGAIGKALLANPLVWIAGIIAGVVAAFKLLGQSMGRTIEGQERLTKITSFFKGLLDGLMNILNKVSVTLFDAFSKPKETIKELGEFIKQNLINRFLAFGEIGKSILKIFSKDWKEGLKDLGQSAIQLGTGLDAEQQNKIANGIKNVGNEMAETAKKAQELAKLEAAQVIRERELNRIRFEYLKEQEKFRQIRDDVSKSTEERIKANDDLGASLLKQSDIEMSILKQALFIAQKRVEIDGETSENLDKVAEARANIADLEERINGFQSEQLVNAVGLRKEAEELAKAQAQLTLEAGRRLTDAKLAAMAEGEEKQIALSKENLRRQLEDLQTEGQLTAELQKNLEEANEKELQKIRDDFAKERFDKAITDFEANIQKEVDLLSAGYRVKETELKRQFSKGLISREQYEADLIAIQSEALKEANDATIKSLQKQLEIAGMTEDKRAEISAKIRDLQIDNENAVLDATIEANQKKVDSDKEAFGKRLQIAEQLTAAGMELFQAIGDFEAQQSENRLAELEKQQAANDDYFAKRQENLDNAIMSDASREAAQKAIDEEKAKRDKAVLDKKREEEIRQAKWEKAQALTSAIISTALATIKALVDPGGVLGVVFAALAAATGAAQIATILSRPIPAFEKGGITGDGLALWGEARPEVAVTKTGDVMFTERPTVSKFDAGTRIFKSVEDFEKNMISTGNKSFEFDYQKMAELMPRNSIELNGNGSWTAIDKENNRRSMINRRIKLN